MAGPGLEAADLLALRPVRIASWLEREGRVVVDRPEPLSRGLVGLLEKLAHLMAARRVRLDELGSLAWRHLDGRTVAEVCGAIRKEFEGDCEPLEERLRIFLGSLHTAGLIAYAGYEDDAIAGWRSRG